MQCWDCSTTETLRVRSVPRAGLCHWLSAWWWEMVWSPSVLGPPECCLLQTCERLSVACPLLGLKGF